MTNADDSAHNTGADNTGDNAGIPAPDSLAELPPRIRVHALAKLLDSTSKQVLSALGELGESARSPQSSVSRDVARRVADTVAGAQNSNQASPSASAAESTTGPDSAAPAESAEPADAVSTQEQSPPQAPVFSPPSPVFLPPEPAPATPAPAEAQPSGADESSDERHGSGLSAASEAGVGEETGTNADGDTDRDTDAATDRDTETDSDTDGGRRRRRRGRRGRGRGKGGDEAESAEQAVPAQEQSAESDRSGDGTDGSAGKSNQNSGKGDAQSDGAPVDSDSDDDAGSSSAGSAESSSRRRRRRRRRKGGTGEDSGTEGDQQDAAGQERNGESETGEDQVRSVRGSTRLEAKRQRRRDGREAGRKRAPVLSESEFLARRESVERTMVVKESAAGGHGKKSTDPTTQIAVLEDGMLVEHFVTSSGSGSIVGNVYLGRVQNVLPSMEAAFVDIGRGRNGVLYAGEVDWDAAGLEGKSRKIEQALETGDSVLVQVTKDPAGHKGARLTTQISLPGRFLVYVPGGETTGISRKLPENERRRLKDTLKRVVPDDAGVIIRTASEGISESELEHDVRRLQSQWEIIKDKSDTASAATSKKKSAPVLLYEEPDLLIKVVRDLFTEDFSKLVVQGGQAWETVHEYVQQVAPDLVGRLDRYRGSGDAFGEYRIDEQITKALDRKVWLPSGGYLVIDRTEAMTVIDVNTGKFTGSGGNLEETVTRNNLESAEEVVRQLRLRDIGGIIVIDFIDMVLESNRDLVLRRLTECLGRDRTRHQVAEVTSLGLVQMTRKRIGTGLLEAFSSSCEHCNGRGVVISTEPQHDAGAPAQTGRQGKQRGGGKAERAGGKEPVSVVPEHTSEQHESVVNAVQAVASASNVAAKNSGGKAGLPQRDTASPDSSDSSGMDNDNHGAAVTSVSETGDTVGTAADPAEVVASAGSEQEPGGERFRDGSVPAEPGAAVAEGNSVPVTPSPRHDSVPASAEAGTEADTTAEVPPPAEGPVRRRARRAASRPAGPPVGASASTGTAQQGHA